MTEHMKEAERLLDEFYLHVSATVSSALADEWSEVEAAQKRSVQARAALLAHIQRGAVPEGWQVVPKEPTPEMIEHGSDELIRPGTAGHRTAWTYAAMLAAAPDHFRDAAADAPAPAEVLGETCIDGGKCHHACTDKCFRRECCVPLSGYAGPWAYTPAEVPMPEPDTSDISGYTPHALRTYGAACRAAGEAAGYARGLKEAGRDAEAFRAAVRLGLCVNCYTSSDCMADGSAAVEIYASEIADSIHVKAIPDPYAAARSAVFAAANQIDALRGEVK